MGCDWLSQVLATSVSCLAPPIGPESLDLSFDWNQGLIIVPNTFCLPWGSLTAAPSLLKETEASVMDPHAEWR